MIKHYCDWCGKQIHEYSFQTRMADGSIVNGKFRLDGKPENELTNHINKTQRHYVEVPSLLVEEENGVKTGYVSLGKPKQYELCAECVAKIWGLRHDSTRA